MNKRVFGLFILMAAMSLCACSKEKDDGNVLSENLFEKSENVEIKEEERVIGSYSFGPLDTNKKSYEYNGRKIEIPFFISGDEENTEVGLLLFVDGKVQPYKIKNELGQINNVEENIHIFQVNPQEMQEFNLIIDPIAGKIGESIGIYFCGILMPSYKSESENTVNYGLYHQLASPLPGILRINKSPENYKEENTFSDYNMEKLPQEIKDKYRREDGTNSLDKFTQVSLSNQENNSANKIVSEDGVAKLTLRAFGGSPGSYRVTIFVDHTPIQVQGKEYIDLQLEKGNMTSCSFDIGVGDYERMSTIYGIVVPTGENCMKDNARVYKTNSQLLINDLK